MAKKKVSSSSETAESKKSPEIWDGAILLPVKSIDKHPLNPNEMGDSEFNELISNIEDDEFDEPIQVVVNKEKEGRYTVIGGHWRLRAALATGLKEIPAVIKDWDEQTQHVNLVRRNMIRGRTNPEKFEVLVDALADYELSDAEAIAAMAIPEDELARLRRAERNADREESESRTSRGDGDIVDEVAVALDDIFSTFGDTVPYDYIMFGYKRKIHFLAHMDAATKQAVDKMDRHLRRIDMNVNQFLTEAINARLEVDGDVESADLDDDDDIFAEPPE